VTKHIRYHRSVIIFQTMTSIDNNDEDSTILSIDDHKLTWVRCEQEKLEPRLALSRIGKEQGPARKAIRLYMEENQITKFDCGSGWYLTLEETEKVTFSEDVCGPYMQPTELARLKQEQRKRCASFKTVAPPKKQRVEEAPS
jgi:hypothetical protein